MVLLNVCSFISCVTFSMMCLAQTPALLSVSADINYLWGGFFCVCVFVCLCPQGTSVLSPVLHIGSVIILAMMIYKKSAVQLFEKHPCLYILAFGFVSAKITNKLVVSQTYFLLIKMEIKDSVVVTERII